MNFLWQISALNLGFKYNFLLRKYSKLMNLKNDI